MQFAVSTLLEQAINQEQQRHAKALAAIESRAPDVNTLERLVRALQARGWKAEALVEPRSYGNNAAVELVLMLSCSEGELFEALEYLGGDGVGIARKVTGDIGCSREYALKLSTFGVRLNAYVHSPARVAA